MICWQKDWVKGESNADRDEKSSLMVRLPKPIAECLALRTPSSTPANDQESPLHCLGTNFHQIWAQIKSFGCNGLFFSSSNVIIYFAHFALKLDNRQIIFKSMISEAVMISASQSEKRAWCGTCKQRKQALVWAEMSPFKATELNLRLCGPNT